MNPVRNVARASSPAGSGGVSPPGKGVQARRDLWQLSSLKSGLETQSEPRRIILAGLQGSGKPPPSGKLARSLQKQGRTPLLVAAEVSRPAAMDQLETLGKQLDLPVFVRKGETDVLRIARDAL